MVKNSGINLPRGEVVQLPLTKQTGTARPISNVPVQLQTGGGGPIFPAMETEIALLKQRADQTDKRLESMDGKLDGLVKSIGDLSVAVAKLPTKDTLASWTQQMAIGALAVAALIVGGIIGGLSWIKPDSPPAAPTVINVQPAPVTVMPPPVVSAPPAVVPSVPPLLSR